MRFFQIPTKRIGHFVHTMNIYFNQKTNSQKNFIDFFSTSGFISNLYFVELLKKKINFIPSKLNQIIINTILFISKISKGFEEHLIKINEYSFNCIDEKRIFFNNTIKTNTVGKNFLENNGIKLNKDKYVCLCVRDNAYLKKFGSEGKDYSYHNFRNQELEVFYHVSKYLADEGYHIVRMGNFPEKKFEPNINKKILDYANSKERSDQLDFFLFENCDFIISTGTGMDQIGNLFNKPAIHSTVPVHLIVTHISNRLYLTKHHYCPKRKRNLKISEIFEYLKDYGNFDDISMNKSLIDAGILFKDNSKDEWIEATKEMIFYIKNGHFQKSDIEEKFWKNYKRLIKETNLQKLHGIKLSSRFSSYFLHKNDEWLN